MFVSILQVDINETAPTASSNADRKTHQLQTFLRLQQWKRSIIKFWNFIDWIYLSSDFDSNDADQRAPRFG